MELTQPSVQNPSPMPTPGASNKFLLFVLVVALLVAGIAAWWFLLRSPLVPTEEQPVVATPPPPLTGEEDSPASINQSLESIETEASLDAEFRQLDQDINSL